MIFVNYYRILEKTRKSSAKYAGCEIGDILATTTRFSPGRKGAHVVVEFYVLEGSEYERVCVKGPIETASIITDDPNDEKALYRVEPVYPPDVPVLTAQES